MSVVHSSCPFQRRLFQQAASSSLYTASSASSSACVVVRCVVLSAASQSPLSRLSAASQPPLSRLSAASQPPLSRLSVAPQPPLSRLSTSSLSVASQSPLSRHSVATQRPLSVLPLSRLSAPLSRHSASSQSPLSRHSAASQPPLSVLSASSQPPLVPASAASAASAAVVCCRFKSSRQKTQSWRSGSVARTCRFVPRSSPARPPSARPANAPIRKVRARAPRSSACPSALVERRHDSCAKGGRKDVAHDGLFPWLGAASPPARRREARQESGRGRRRGTRERQQPHARTTRGMLL